MKNILYFSCGLALSVPILHYMLNVYVTNWYKEYTKGRKTVCLANEVPNDSCISWDEGMKIFDNAKKGCEIDNLSYVGQVVCSVKEQLTGLFK